MRKETVLILMILMSTQYAYVQVGIGTFTPDSSAQLDVTSTNKGFLPPRMTTAERDAITLPAVGLTIYNTTVNCLQWWNGTLWYDGCKGYGALYPFFSVFCSSGPTAIVDVTNPVTGRTWMDRNLGAFQAATSSADVASYGDLYQWGRGSDGHQCRLSVTTNTLSISDQPESGNFITPPLPFDNWRIIQNDNLWQGINGVNNPCPSGYRLPTRAELDEERQSWISNDAAGALASPLKLPLAGFREDSGSLGVGTIALYWSSTVSFTNSQSLYFLSSIAIMPDWRRASGLSVRCIKN